MVALSRPERFIVVWSAKSIGVRCGCPTWFGARSLTTIYRPGLFSDSTLEVVLVLGIHATCIYVYICKIILCI